MHYQRMLALTESTNNPIGVVPTAEMLAELRKKARKEGQDFPERDSWEEILHRRQLGATMPLYGPDPIQFAADLPLDAQYREPQDLAKKLIASYARHVALRYPHPKDPSIKVTSVKVYRVTHNIITPVELSKGYSPLDKTRYMVYFQGEFDPAGNLIQRKVVDPNGKVRWVNDPFLYWYLPIVMVPPDYPGPGTAIRVNVQPPEDWSPENWPPKGWRLLDCYEIHAKTTED
jgi:hypothetical protein